MDKKSEISGTEHPQDDAASEKGLGQNPTTPNEGEQPLTSQPDFAALGATEHIITPGAVMHPGSQDDTPPPPDGVSGLDAEEKRGRGRPALTEEEREQRRQEKNRKKREARAAEKTGSKPVKEKAAQPAAVAADPNENEKRKLAIAETHAGMVCNMLDLMAKGISDGTYTPSDQQRQATTGAWAAYLHQEGIEMPAWVTLCVVSGMHVMPAFYTEPGKKKAGGVWAKCKAWWHYRFG